jgi:pimeloyl-ACP methyl ester carboxylesterase
VPAVLDFLAPWAPARHPPSFTSECGGTAGTPRPAAISLTAADGVRLHGETLGSGEVAVVLSHEYPADLCGWFPYASELARAGLRVVLVDARTSGTRLDLDVAAATDEARALGSTSVVVMGASLGAASSLLAAGRDCLFLSGVVSVSGEPDLRSFGGGVPPLVVWPYAARITAPLLLVGSRDDGLVSPSDLQRLLSLARSQSKSETLVDGGAHGWDLLEGTAASDQARSAVLSFLQSAGAPVSTGCGS